MSVLAADVFEAFHAINGPEQKALRVAAALRKRADDVALLRSGFLLRK